MLDIVTKGSIDRSVTIRIIDSTDGTPETGVVFDTAGIDLWYRREGEALTSITEATLATLTAAHTDGGFLHVGDGYYRLDLPDAAFATGAEHVDVGGTVTGMIVIGGRVRLTGLDVEDATRAGLTALPDAAANAAGGLPISTAGALDLDARLAANAVADEWLDRTDGVETGVTPRQALRAGLAVLAGLASGGPGTSAFEAIGNAGTTRVTITADSNGDRSTVTLNL